MGNKKSYDSRYIKYSNEARELVEEWYNNNHLTIDKTSIYIIWFAFTKNGYRCMVSSHMYENNFFEISKNMKNQETVIRVLQQVECIVHPSEDVIIPMSWMSQDYLLDD